ncbi:MAG: hypothetical protein Q9202_006949 [Teloschistes flavicans]
MDEEALRCVGYLYDESYIPISDRSDEPFRLLDLPRELRDIIYEYALLFPSDRYYILSRNVVRVQTRRSFRPYDDMSQYWGHEEFTRLFRVNCQVSTESLKLFYTTLSFRFCHVTAKAGHGRGNGPRALDDLFSPKAKELVRNIWIRVEIEESTTDAEKFMTDLMTVLPNLKGAIVNIGSRWYGAYGRKKMLERSWEGLFDRLVKLLNPLRSIPNRRIIYPRFKFLLIDDTNRSTAMDANELWKFIYTPESGEDG